MSIDVAACGFLSEQVSVFANAFATAPYETAAIGKILDDIENGRDAAEVADVHKHYRAGDECKYKSKKNGLRAVTFQGMFERRNKESLIQSSGCTIADFDHLGTDTDDAFKAVCGIPYVVAAWRSPSGEGIKALCRTPLVRDHEQHDRLYGSLAADIKRRLPQFAENLDTGGRDVSRLCFVSHDPGLFRNPDAIVFAPSDDVFAEPEPEPQEPAPAESNGHALTDDVLKDRMFGAKNGDKARRLWDGDIAGYKSQSEADLALCQILAFWTHKDAERIDRLFRQSGLNRDKWDRPDYLKRTIEKAIERCPDVYKERTEDNIPWSDTYNADRLVKAYGEHLRFVGEWDSILVYDAGIWPIDHQRKRFEYAKATALEMVNEARKLLRDAKDDDAQKIAKAYFEHAKTSLSTGQLNAMLTNAQSCKSIPLSHKALNPHADMLAVDNGVVMLKTGVFVQHDPAYLFTAKMPVAYDPNATCPLWEHTLHVIFGGCTEADSTEDGAAILEERYARDARAKRLTDCLQRILGYALTAEVLTHALFMLVGKGRNGKSLIINTILKMFGDLGCVVNQSLFMESKNDRHPTERATLFGKRLAVTSETSKNRRLNESFVKTATGDDLLNARRMRENEWQFQPTHTLLIATNHRPVADPEDFALWERIWLIPFEQVFYDPDKLSPEELADPTILKQDKRLPEKLKAELPGILNWCIKGCVDYYRDGLLMPDEVKAATQKYRAEENNVKGFTEDDGACVTDANRDPRLLPDDVFNDSAKNLYARYSVWCEENETQAVTQTTFGSRLRAMGFENYTSNGRARYRRIQAIAPKRDDDGAKQNEGV
jgi:putative DNA primase/helicase